MAAAAEAEVKPKRKLFAALAGRSGNPPDVGDEFPLDRSLSRSQMILRRVALDLLADAFEEHHYLRVE